MKSIMISIKPKWCAKIMNGEKTIEIRKKFPKDYVGWVYIYCTKGGLNLIYEQDYNEEKQTWEKPKYYLVDYGDKYSLNGKVVARFWCGKVDDYVNGRKWSWKNGCPMWGACNDYEYILKDTCLTEDELYDYCEDLAFSAIHISDLEIFDKPKELSEFKRIKIQKGCLDCPAYGRRCSQLDYIEVKKGKCLVPIKLTKAPQSMCYIDIE